MEKCDNKENRCNIVFTYKITIRYIKYQFYGVSYYLSITDTIMPFRQLVVTMNEVWS